MEAAGSYYMRDAGVALLRLGAGSPATTEEKDWGLIDYDDEGNVAAVEIRRAATVLPTDLLAVLPDPSAISVPVDGSTTSMDAPPGRGDKARH